MRRFDSETGRGANGGEDGDAGHQRFLRQFEAGASADQDQLAGERYVVQQHLRADQFVDSVVASDILTQQHQVALQVKQSGCVQSAGPLEDGLLAPQRFRQPMNNLRWQHQGILRQQRATLHAECFDGRFAAHATTGGGVEVPLQAFEIHLDAGVQLDGDGVTRLAAISAGLGTANAVDLLGALQDAFGEQKARGQLEVMTGSPHSDGDGLVPEADFEGFFDGQEILKGTRRLSVDSLNRYREDISVHRI